MGRTKAWPPEHGGTKSNDVDVPTTNINIRGAPEAGKMLGEGNDHKSELNPCEPHCFFHTKPSYSETNGVKV